MRVVYFALQRPEYPRNERVRAHLEAHDHAAIDIVPLTQRPGFFRHSVELAREVLRLQGRADAVILAEFSLSFAFWSWLAAKKLRAMHIVDFFVGHVETQIEDRGVVGRRTLRSIALHALERIAAASSDLMLIDTEVRAETIRARFGGRAISLPVGAPSWASHPPLLEPRSTVRVLYYGNYIPLHGVTNFLTAIDQLHSENQLDDFELTMVGEGDDRENAIRMVERSRWRHRVRILPSVSVGELAAQVRDHDIVIGIFGESAKAASVIANKVWQGLSCNRIVVTRESPALDELRSIVGDRLITASGPSAREIGDAIIEAVAQVRRGGNRCNITLPLEEYVESRFKALSDQLHKRRSRR